MPIQELINLTNTSESDWMTCKGCTMLKIRCLERQDALSPTWKTDAAPLSYDRGLRLEECRHCERGLEIRAELTGVVPQKRKPRRSTVLAKLEEYATSEGFADAKECMTYLCKSMTIKGLEMTVKVPASSIRQWLDRWGLKTHGKPGFAKKNRKRINKPVGPYRRRGI